MKEPLVSIIVPIYNAEKYLPQCICSCLEQSYQNIEVLLVDDGSTDDSLSVARKYAEQDLRINVIHQNNAGVSAARNAGLERATGEYITFLDSDDELFENAIEIMLTNMQNYDADIVSAMGCIVNNSGRETCRGNDGGLSIHEGNEPLILSLKYDRHTNSVWAKLFSRTILDGVRFVEGRRINEDGYFVFQCFTKKPRLVKHNECVYKYFVRENSSTRGEFSEKYFDMIYFSDKKMEYIQENHPELIDFARDMEVSTHLFFLEVLCRDAEGTYRMDAKNSIRLVRKRYLKYKPINRHEKIMAAIVASGLYPLYKRIFLRRFRK